MRLYPNLIFSLVGLIIYTNLPGQSCDGLIEVHPINLQPKERNDLGFLDTLILDRNFFFSSEAHGNSQSFKFSRKLITYLASKERLQWIAIETDYAHGYALNQFLETGNKKGLENFIASQPDFTGYKNVDYFAHYQYLKDLRDSLSLGFRFVGIDVCKEGFKGSTSSILKLLSNYEEFQPIVSSGEKLLENREISYRKMQNWVDEVNSQNIQIRKAFESDNMRFEFEQLENIIFNVEQSINLRSKGSVNRELQIADNFQRYFQNEDRVYCQFGYGHVLTNRWPKLGDSGKSFVDWLEMTEDYKNRSVIFAFSPNVDDALEFSLFRDDLCPAYKSLILKSEFPVLVDFRNDSVFKDQFQFVLINER